MWIALAAGVRPSYGRAGSSPRLDAVREDTAPSVALKHGAAAAGGTGWKWRRPVGEYVTHLESAIDATRLPAGTLQTMHAQRPLWVRYDLDAVGKAATPETFIARPATMWRYRELLPVPPDAPLVSLGECLTPLLPAPRLGESLGLDDLWIKDESHLPSGSFKSRGMAMAVTMARHLGVSRLAVPTAGNAGGALAAYAARAGLEAYVFMPADTPVVNQMECVLAGAKVYLVNGLIGDCGAIVRNGVAPMNWFDCSTLKEPYRLEGKKTMGLELAEQLGWFLPDVIVYPTGGGTGLIGMWKAFTELRTLGWLRKERLPRMVAVQSDGCAPIVRAFQAGERFARPWENARTVASGLRVPAAVGDFMMLDALRESGGCALAVPEESIVPAMQEAVKREGISVCPEAGACVAALGELRRSGFIDPQERVVLFNTGAATKYVESLPLRLPTIADPSQVDYARLA
ncbi:MAG: threonine synthase [Planctomycetes bacterium]|nr:threonine synthase [Planctomycetota bacterium]